MGVGEVGIDVGVGVDVGVGEVGVDVGVGVDVVVGVDVGGIG